MPEELTLTDSTLEPVLNGKKPALILFTTGEGLRGDFSTAFKTAIQQNQQIVFARIDPKANPRAAERFGISDKPMLVAWYCGQELVRRPRPWGSDVPLAIEMLQSAYKANGAEDEPAELVPAAKSDLLYDDKPVTVTDATFQQDVIDYSLPVLVDFWAEWCGPCRMVAPILEKLAKEFVGQVRIAKVNVDENPGLSQTFKIQSIPLMMMFKERTIVFSQPGALPEPSLRNLIQQLIALKVPPKQQPVNQS